MTKLIVAGLPWLVAACTAGSAPPARVSGAAPCRCGETPSRIGLERAPGAGGTDRAVTPQKIYFPYVVRPGDTIKKITTTLGPDPFASGLDMYADAKNAEFRRQNPNPDALTGGTIFWIPDRDDLVAIRFLQFGEPEKNQPCRVFLEGIEMDETFSTDVEGMSRTVIPAMLQRFQMDVGGQMYQLSLTLAPSSTVEGIQQRLDNLGYGVESTGQLDEPTREAIKAFQREHEITPSGELDDETRSEIIQAYGS